MFHMVKRTNDRMNVKVQDDRCVLFLEKEHGRHRMDPINQQNNQENDLDDPINQNDLSDPDRQENPIQVAGRLFGALEYLAKNGQSTLTDLTQALDLNKSTTHRVLASLQYMNYVRQDPETGHYEATFKLVDLADHLLEQVDVAQIVRPYLKQLSDRARETVHFVERDKNQVIYVDKVDPHDHAVPMTSYIGSRIPFYRTGVGKAMMANLTDPEILALWDSCTIQKRTAYTITDPQSFLEEVTEIRRKGYALDNEENEAGVRCIAAALGIEGGARYAFSISVPIGRMDNERIRDLSGMVLEAKNAMDAELSGKLQERRNSKHR